MPVGKKTESLEIVRVNKGILTCCLLGTTPIILNRMSQKVMGELLMPRKKTAADKAQNLKHNPYREFMDSPYIDADEDGPTLIQHLSSAVKGSMMGAAMDVPGSSKAQIGRLCWVEGERIPIYGVPQMMMSVTRSADMNRTPDVRTRCVVPKWATVVRISFVKPMLNETAIVNLLVSGGISQGIGDWRTGKGKGTYGSFSIVDADDEEYLHILKTGRRKVQKIAMEHPECYDRETQDLFAWYQEELVKRGHEQTTSASVTIGNGKKSRPVNRIKGLVKQ